MRSGLPGTLRSWFVAGVLVVLPLLITVWLGLALTRWVDGALQRILPASLNPEHLLGFRIPGLGIAITLVAVLLVGAGMRYYAGRALVDAYERLLTRVPVLSSVYLGFKQLFNTVFSPSALHFRQVLLVEYPRRGLWVLAFNTGGADFLDPAFAGGDEVLNVFIPTTPNPTSGFYLLVARSDVRLLDVTVEEAFKLIMSAGIVQPEAPRRRARRLGEE